MRYYDVSYYDDETGENFDYHTEIEDPTIAGDLNAMVAVLRAVGYGDGLIEDKIGSTYFNRKEFEDLDVAMAEAIDELHVSRATDNSILDDLDEFPEDEKE